MTTITKNSKSQIKELDIAKAHKLPVSIKSYKVRNGHEGESLYSCKVFYKNKHVANYNDLDYGNSDFNDMDVVNQKLFDEATTAIKNLPAFYEPVLRKELQPTLDGIIHDLCIYTRIEKIAKRQSPVSCFDEKAKRIVTFKKSGGHTVDSIQKYISTLEHTTPFYSMPFEKVMSYYLKEHNII